jgi:hypothetical protein
MNPVKIFIENFHAPRPGTTNNENLRLGRKHETIGDQREPTH